MLFYCKYNYYPLLSFVESHSVLCENKLIFIIIDRCFRINQSHPFQCVKIISKIQSVEIIFTRNEQTNSWSRKKMNLWNAMSTLSDHQSVLFFFTYETNIAYLLLSLYFISYLFLVKRNTIIIRAIF